MYRTRITNAPSPKYNSPPTRKHKTHNQHAWTTPHNRRAKQQCAEWQSTKTLFFYLQNHHFHLLKRKQLSPCCYCLTFCSRAFRMAENVVEWSRCCCFLFCVVSVIFGFQTCASPEVKLLRIPQFVCPSSVFTLARVTNPDVRIGQSSHELVRMEYVQSTTKVYEFLLLRQI